MTRRNPTARTKDRAMIVFRPAAGILIVSVGGGRFVSQLRWGAEPRPGRLGEEIKRAGRRELVVKGCGSR